MQLLKPLLIAFLLGPLLSHAAERPEYEVEDSANIVTPHIPWAKPLWGPKPKVLFILMGGGTREAYELAQRMDLDFDVFGTAKYWIFAHTSDYYNEGIPLLDERMDEIRKMFAKNPDVIVVGSIRMSCFPGEVTHEILRRVKEGAALVSCNMAEYFDIGHLPKEVKAAVISKPVGHLSSLFGGVTWGEFHRTESERTERFRLATNGGVSYGEKRIPMVLGDAVAYQVGKGHYVGIHPYGAGPGYSTGPTLGPSVPVAFEDLIETEYFYSLILKTIRWCTPRCRPPVSIRGVEPNNAVLKLSMADGETCSSSVSLENSGKEAQTGELHTVLRDQSRRVLAESRLPLNVAPGASRIEVKLPAPKAGRCWVDHWVRVEGKVMDWGSGAFQVRTPCSVRIQHVREPGRPVNLYGKVNVSGAAPGAVLRMECEDAYGRVLGRQERALPQGGGTITFHFYHGAGPDPHHFLCARVVAPGSGRLLAEDRHPLLFEPVERDEHYVYSTGGCKSSWLGYQRALRVKYLGADGQRGDVGGIAGYVGIRPGPFFTHVGGCNYRGVACLNDDTGYRKELAAGLKAIATKVKPLGGHIFNLGDDTGVANTLCKIQPYWCQKLRDKLSARYRKKVAGLNAAWGLKLKDFKDVTVAQLSKAKLPEEDFALLKREWRDEYSSIQALSRAWQADLASWDEVTPEFLASAKWVTPCWRAYLRSLKREFGTVQQLSREWGENISSWEEVTPDRLTGCRKDGNLVPWISYLWFMEDSYISIMELAADSVRQVIPEAAVGQDASALENILPEVLRHTSYYCPYYRTTAVEKMRSFARRPGRYGSCIGTYGGKAVPEAVRRHQPITVAFAGGNTTMFWAMSYGLHGDLTMNPNRAGYMWESIYELKQGLGSLLARGARQHSGIAMLHSRASGHAQKIDQSMCDVLTSQVHFQALLEDLGLQYNYVSSLDLREGVLGTGEYRVLVLPYCQAIGEDEAEKISGFVKLGGAVIADLRPGVFNRYCRKLEAGSLDSVFGIKRKELKSYRLLGTFEGSGGIAEGVKFEDLVTDSSVELDGGKALAHVGKTPCLILNQFGEGKAILLNWFVGRYKAMLDDRDLSIRPLYRAILKEAGVERRVAITAGGRDVIGAEVIEYRLGSGSLVCLDKMGYSSEKFPLEAEVKLPEKAFVYDVRSGKPLGQTDRIPVTFQALSQHVYALLPYEVSGLQLSCPAKIQQGGTLRPTANIRQKAKADFGPHLVRYRVYGPDGEEILFRRRKQWSEDGRARTDYRIAFNEQPGSYRLRACEVLTGYQAEATFEVTE